jgi:hypothetical protein
MQSMHNLTVLHPVLPLSTAHKSMHTSDSVAALFVNARPRVLP